MEVAPMTLNIQQRPSLLAAACAPSANAVPVTAALPNPAPRVHQLQIQAELALAAGRNDGTYGFKGSNDVSVPKWMTDGGSGVPPRGRPV